MLFINEQPHYSQLANIVETNEIFTQSICENNTFDVEQSVNIFCHNNLLEYA